ncbi:unnamed protein product [Callosobruchus maculatus]|nr:unnamed protein product [Callosobruchus maculatus]
MGNETVRDDFLNGRNGAAQLTEADLKLLDDFYPAVTPKHEAGNPTTFTNEVQSAAEHLLAAVDGKPKDVFGGTYSQIKEILGKIHESGYFDQAQVFESYNEEAAAVESEIVMVAETNASSEVAMVASGAVPPLSNHQQPPQVGDIPVIESLTIEARAAVQPPPTQVPLEVVQASTPAAALPPQQQAVPPQAPVAAAATVVPPPEQQIYYQPTAPSAVPPPQQQTPRPITEMLGTGSFFFLQESEIDPIPEQIPSQTFTNQNFSGGPPPPAGHQPAPAGALPPHFAASIPQQPPMGGAAPVANHQPMQPVQAIGNNGLVDDGPMGQPKDQQQQQQQHLVAKEAMQAGPPRTAQPYYQDNGYSRQQQQQRGQHPPRPRPVNARH